MTDTNGRVDVNLVTRRIERTTKSDILRIHVHCIANLLERAPEPRVREVLDSTLANHHPAHARVRYGHVLRCTDNVVGPKELERTILEEEILVPLLDDRKLLEILHHVEPGRDVVGALEKLEEILGLENHVRIDPHHNVVINLSLEWLLVRTLQGVSAETLGPGEMNNRRILLGNHNLMTLGSGLHNQVRPAQHKLA